jgi:hypothetical protein
MVPRGFGSGLLCCADTLVELTKDTHTDSTRYSAATALLDRGYGRPAQSLDLHLSADAITIVLEATAEVSDDAGELADGDVEDSPPDALA